MGTKLEGTLLISSHFSTTPTTEMIHFKERGKIDMETEVDEYHKNGMRKRRRRRNHHDVINI